MNQFIVKARVIRSLKNDFECKIIGSDKVVIASARAEFLKGNKHLVVGDFIEISPLSEDKYQVESVQKRENEIFRILVRENKKKVMAANCDYVVILNSVSKPAFKRGLIDRFLVRSVQWGIKPIVVFNKMDEYSERDFDINFEYERLKFLNIPTFEISAKFDNYQNNYLTNGFSELEEYLKGKTSIFLGQSGVGKSRTISRLSKGLIDLRVKSVGKSGKGQHTTTWSEIVDCEKFSVIDSPGIRSLSLDDLIADELIDYFPDLQGQFSQCKFKNCGHVENSKGCFFAALYKLKSIEARIILSRLDAYLKIKSEITQRPKWEKKY